MFICPFFITISIIQIEKSIVGVPGIRTQGRRMLLRLPTKFNVLLSPAGRLSSVHQATDFGQPLQGQISARHAQLFGEKKFCRKLMPVSKCLGTNTHLKQPVVNLLKPLQS